jgi:hypothetical protein
VLINPIIRTRTRYFRHAYPPTRDNILFSDNVNKWNVNFSIIHDAEKYLTFFFIKIQKKGHKIYFTELLYIICNPMIFLSRCYPSVPPEVSKKSLQAYLGSICSDTIDIYTYIGGTALHIPSIPVQGYQSRI